MVLRGTLELVGHAECSWGWDPHCPQITVAIDPARQGAGYGAEVLKTLLEYLFKNTPAHNVSGWMASWNQAALDFTAAHGFKESRKRSSVMRSPRSFQLVALLLSAELLQQASPLWVAPLLFQVFSPLASPLLLLLLVQQVVRLAFQVYFLVS